VVVVAGHQHDLGRGGVGALRQRRAEPLEERPRERKRVAQRTLAQLDRVTEQNDALDPAERVVEQLAQLGPAQQVAAGAAAEVEVGDDERGSQSARELVSVG
jgi:hypothetical protein